MNEYAWQCRGCGRITAVNELPRCSVCGNDDFADRVDVVTVATLVGNLAAAGFGQRMFLLGAWHGFWEGGCRGYDDEANPCWEPGCGRGHLDGVP